MSQPFRGSSGLLVFLIGLKNTNLVENIVVSRQVSLNSIHGLKMSQPIRGQDIFASKVPICFSPRNLG